MARFTVSDCMENIENRFDMTLAASLRARQISQSGQTQIHKDLLNNDKPTVLALREISENLVDDSILSKVE